MPHCKGRHHDWTKHGLVTVCANCSKVYGEHREGSRIMDKWVARFEKRILDKQAAYEANAPLRAKREMNNGLNDAGRALAKLRKVIKDAERNRTS